jgi:hypothetical protein
MSPREQVIELAGPKVQFLDPELDDAIVGVGSQASGKPLVIYDHERMSELLTDRYDGDLADALEWISYNIAGAYDGPQTPILLHRIAPPERKPA